MSQQKSLFDKITVNYEKYLRFKVSQYLPKDVVADAVQSAILHFYTYHLEKFNMEYNSEDIEKRARNYFLTRIFWYISKKNYYGKKIYDEISNVNVDTDNIFYSISNDEEDEHKKVKIQNIDSQFVNNIDDQIWMNQFKAYVKKMHIRTIVKRKIVKFLDNHDKKIFGSNLTYYYKMLKSMINTFNTVNA